MRPNTSLPFAVSTGELQEVEDFCQRNGLDQIGRICAELRVLRTEYLVLSQRVARQKAMIEAASMDSNARYAQELDVLMTEKPHAPTVP